MFVSLRDYPYVSKLVYGKVHDTQEPTLMRATFSRLEPLILLSSL